MPNPASAERLVTTWKEWLEGQPLAHLLPKDPLVEALRRLSEEEVARGEVAPRIEKAFDAALERLRRETRSGAEVLGPAATERLVDAAGDLEPDERTVRAFFEERAVADLLGDVLYDGISEFMKKANQLSDLLPGVAAAKKLAGGVGGFLGALGGGIAGSIAGNVREDLQQKLEGQVRAFLSGFGKIAVERAVRFAVSEGNRKLFREMRRNLARKALAAPLRDLVRGLDDARARALRGRLSDAAVRALAEERASRRLEGALERFLAANGSETTLALLRRFGLEPLPAAPVARILAPALARFLETEEAKALLDRRA